MKLNFKQIRKLVSESLNKRQVADSGESNNEKMIQGFNKRLTLKLKGIPDEKESGSDQIQDKNIIEIEAEKQALQDGALSAPAFKEHIDRLRFGVYPSHMQMVYDQYHDDNADFLRVKNSIRIPMIEKHLIERTPEELSQTLYQIHRNKEALEVLGAGHDN